MPPELEPTLTHARLRAAQGDVSGARAILERLLALEPANAEARRLLEALAGRRNRESAEAPPPPLARPRSAGAGELTDRFRQALGRNRPHGRRERIRRLQAWLVRIGGRL